MLQDNKLKIMNFFFEEPVRYFHIRELARLSKIAHTSVKNHLAELEKEELIKKVKTPIYDSFIANEENRTYKIYKQQHMIMQLYSSKLIDYLEENLHPKCIILFGSVRKGEYKAESDIDLFVQTSQKNINLEKYEQILKHKISLFFEENITQLSSELFNNIANGIKLSGYLKVR